jgi:hypothetical protein
MTSLKELLDRLRAWATAPPRNEDLLAARRHHFERHGEPHEEDRTHVVRLDRMLDYYVFDYRPGGGTLTTIERFIEAEAAALTPEEVDAYRALAGTVHGVFEVRRIKDGEVRVRDLFSGTDHDVTERRNTAGLAKGDLIEARLLPYDGKLLFSGAFLYHPREVRKLVLAEVKRLKKAAARGGTIDVPGFVAQLARMALRVERYRNVRLESIYDFENDRTAPRLARG